MAREGATAAGAIPNLALPDLHHSLSHHQNDAEKIAKLAKIDTYHSKMFAYYLEKLRSTPDGDGSLLDHSVIVYGSGLSNANVHSLRQSTLYFWRVGERARSRGAVTSGMQRRRIRRWQICT